jgi:hypothetical protein
VQADPASARGGFAEGLLDPALPVPAEITGRPAKRYGVYRNNVTVSLIRAMEANFPVVRRLLGEQYFAGLAREFVQKHPPRSPLIFHYGSDFSTYLDEQEDLQSFPYLGDIARLEQQMRVSYHAADAPHLLATHLQQFAGDMLMDAVFVPHPAMAIIASNFAIHSIYDANQADQRGDVENLSEAQAVLVTRPAFDVELHRLSRAQVILIQSLGNKQTFGLSADAALAAEDNFDLSGAISLLLTSGAFLAIDGPQG